MTLNQFTVTRPFCAWKPGDREFPERRVYISPGPKRLFTDETEPCGLFIKFLESGSWYEAARDEFVRATILLSERHQTAITGQRGA